MDLKQFTHWNLPTYNYIFNQETQEVYLPSRDNYSSRLLISLDELKNVYKSIHKIYLTVSDNIRILELNTVKFYHKVNGTGTVYISRKGDNCFIELHLCDIERILSDSKLI